MKKILLLAFISIMIMVPNSLSAQNKSALKVVPGSWLGVLNANGMNLRVIFNIKLTGKDSLSATLDSPDQGAKDIPVEKVTLDKQKLVISATSINGEYTGTVAGDSTISGTWAQNGNSLPLNLKKQAKK
jgi:hypothetical protein